MHTYVVYDRVTGEVLNYAVCPGPFEVSQDFIEALVEAGNLGRARFTEVDARAATPRVVNPNGRAAAPTPEPSRAVETPIDFDRMV